MQILYNNLTRAHLPKTTAKPSNSQIHHVKIHFPFFQLFFWQVPHITQKLIKRLGSDIFGFLRTICVPFPRQTSYMSFRHTYTVYSNHINMYGQKYTKTIFLTKRINAKWKLMIINFNNLKIEKGILSYFSDNVTL